MQKATKAVKNGRAKGLNCLSGEIIKAAREHIEPVLTKAFNYVLINSSYPTEWGEGIIQPLFKEGSPFSTYNHWCITLI